MDQQTIQLIGGPHDGRRKKFVSPVPKDVISFTVAGVIHRYHLIVRDGMHVYMAEGYHGQLIKG